MFEKIKKVANYFPYCLTIVDVKSKGRPCVFVNDKFLENTGYEADEAIGRNLSYLQGKRTQVDTIEFMRKSFDEGVSCIQDLINYKKDGTPFLNRLLLLPLKGEEGELFYIGFQNDITEVKGLSHNNAALSKVQNGEIKHIVNNSLTIILGKMALVLKKSTTEDEINEAVKELSDLFKRINDYALQIEDVSSFEDFGIDTF